MRSHPGVAAKVFQTLAGEEINIEMISTSPIKISCVIRADARAAGGPGAPRSVRARGLGASSASARSGRAAMTRVAVVGATGAVGRTMLALLRERDFPADEIVPFASERSAGREIDGGLIVRALTRTPTSSGFDIALFSAGAGDLARVGARGSSTPAPS